MKKKILALSVILLLTAASFCACGKKDTEQRLTKVTLNEVAHSIFYAPQYVAVQEGYFTQERIELTLVNGFGADKTMTAVLSGEADIGFMGAEATIYAYTVSYTHLTLPTKRIV